MKVLFFVVVGLNIVAAATDYFSSRADAMLNSFDATLNARCSGEARQKAATFQSMDKRHQNAVAIVNLYTQQCIVGTYDVFYALLNAQIASSNCHSYFREFEALLNEAIKILSPHYGVRGGTVYRGQCDSFPNGGQYTPGRFFSTSTSPFTGSFFALWKGCFVIISNVQGLNVEVFSKYSSEQEVLIVSTASYYVEKKIKDSNEIYNELKKHGPLVSNLYYYLNYPPVSTLVIMKQLEDETGYISIFYKILSEFSLW